MKKCFVWLLVLAMLLGCAGASAEALAGGWNVVENHAEVPQDLKDAIESLNQAGIGFKVEPVAVLATQVVAGVNYSVVCKVTEEGEKPSIYFVLAVVYIGVDGTFSMQAAQGLPGAEEVTPGLAGGWTVAENPNEIPEDAKNALNKALDGFVGSDVQPVLYLGSQVVAGRNHCFLCQLTPVVLNPEPHFAVVTVYQDLQGGAKILDMLDVDHTLSSLEEEEN